eukprot:4878203-Prymnesium_polylepis.1
MGRGSLLVVQHHTRPYNPGSPLPIRTAKLSWIWPKLQFTFTHPRIFGGKFDYTTGHQEGAVPHQDRPARIPWSVGVRVR